MCLAYPAQVTAVAGDGTAEVLVRGRRQRMPLTVLAGQGVAVAAGDWLLAQSGVAVARIDESEAAQRLALLREITGGEHAR
jgi:hydrogenase assembly chaperone HypC/HupF